MENLGALFHGESAKVTKFHKLRFAGIHLAQPFQCVVKVEYLDITAGNQFGGFGQGDSFDTAAALIAEVGTGMVYQHAAHHE